MPATLTLPDLALLADAIRETEALADTAVFDCTPCRSHCAICRRPFLPIERRDHTQLAHADCAARELADVYEPTDEDYAGYEEWCDEVAARRHAERVGL